MPGYRIFFLDRDDRVAKTEAIYRDNDEIVVQKYKAAIDGLRIEIWQGARLVICIGGKPSVPFVSPWF